MVGLCHDKTWRRALIFVALAFALGQTVYADSPKRSVIAQKQDPKKPVSFDELDTVEETIKEPSEDEPEAKAPPALAETEAEAPRQRRSPIPPMDQLIEAKLKALKAKLDEQEASIIESSDRLTREQIIEKETFDTNAYFSLVMENNAPAQEYRLTHTEVFVDGRRIAQGGIRNRGLPRQSEIFFGAVTPGCHEVTVKARYVRLKNDLISRFKVSRVERVIRSQAFVAKNGYRVELGIEGYESHNSLFNWMRGPALRFNRKVRPNFLPGAPIVSMDDVLKQGRVRVSYHTEDGPTHRLLEKSLSIDGLPVLAKEKHDEKTEGTLVFDAPLAQGKHTLNVELLFAEKKWVGGGPLFNFRLKFNRDFFVMSGQTSVVNLTGMPHDGFRSSPENSRYARATSRILSEENREFFPDMMCRELKAKEQAALKQAAPPAVVPAETPPAEEEPQPAAPAVPVEGQEQPQEEQPVPAANEQETPPSEETPPTENSEEVPPKPAPGVAPQEAPAPGGSTDEAPRLAPVTADGA